MDLLDAITGEDDQVDHVLRCGVTLIDDEIGVLLGDLGASDAMTLEPHALDEATGRIIRRIAEDAARAGQADRLALLAALVCLWQE